jgi:flagellar transcriptional activator FlhD
MKEQSVIDESMLAEIREANLTYLILAQRMLRADRAQGMFRLGIGEDVATIVETLSTAQMIKIASTSFLMCKLRFDDRMVWDLITGHDELAMKGAHAAILLARALPEAA